ncbi:hypothetical protein VaNZ11_007279, partial [Volvox africanus]
MSNSGQTIVLLPAQLSSGRDDGERPLARASPAPVSFSDSLVSKLPVGSRFTSTGPTAPIASGANVTDDASSALTHGPLKSAASTMRGAPEAVGPSVPEDALMASLHVKFSASTRFNASDAGSLLGAAAAAAADERARTARFIRSGNMRPRVSTPVPKSYSATRRASSRRSSSSQLQLQPSRGRRQQDTSLPNLDSGGPFSGIMKALSGRHRRSHSLDSGFMRRTSGTASGSGSPVSSPARRNREGSRVPPQRRRRPSASVSGEELSDGGSSRRSGWVQGLGAIGLWSIFGGGGGDGGGLRRSQSAPSGRSERTGYARHSRSHSFGSMSAESSLGGADGNEHSSGGTQRGRSRRRRRSRSRVGNPDGEAEVASFPFLGRRTSPSRSHSRSRSRSRGRSTGEQLHNAVEEHQSSAAVKRGSRPLTSFFSWGPRQRSSMLEGEGNVNMRRSRTLPTSSSIGQVPDFRPSRLEPQESATLDRGPFGSPRAAYLAQRDSGQKGNTVAFNVGVAGGQGLEKPTPALRGHQPFGPLEMHRPPQLQIAPAAASASVPVLSGAISSAHWASIAAASQSGSLGPYASHAGSLPSLALVPSPTIRLSGDRNTPLRHTPPYPQQLRASPLQKVHSPDRRTPHDILVPSLRRQATGMEGLPRSASRQGTSRQGARSRAAQRRFERAASDGGDRRDRRRRRSGGGDGNAILAAFARSRSEGRKSFAAQRRERNMSGAFHVDNLSQPPSTGAAGEGTRSRFMNWLRGARRKLSGPETPSPERPNASRPISGVAGPSATLASVPIPKTRSPDVPSPAADTTLQPDAAAPSTPVADVTAEIPDRSASRDSLSKQLHEDSASDVRDSLGMQVRPAPGPLLLRVVPRLDRLRPTPLEIPSDPGMAGLAPPAGAGVAVTQVAAAAAPGKGETKGGDGVTGVTPAKTRKGGWSQLGRVLGAVMRFRSPSKATPDKQEPTAAVISSPPLPPSPPLPTAPAGITISASKLPKPAFPVLRRVTGSGGDTSEAHTKPEPGSPALTKLRAVELAQPLQPAAGRDTSRDSAGRPERSYMMPSAFADQSQTVLTDDDGAGAVGADTQVTAPSKRKALHGRVKSDLPLRGRVTSRSRPATATVGGAHSAAGRPATAAAAVSTADCPSVPLLFAPTSLHMGRSVSPLGRSMVAASGGGGPGSDGRRGTPVIMISALATAAPGPVLVSPLRSCPPRATVAAGEAANRVDDSTFTVVDFSGQTVLLGHDRIPGLASALRPASGNHLSPVGHLPRLLRPTATGIPFGYPHLPLPNDTAHVDPMMFPATALQPSPPILDADGLPLQGALGAPTGRGAVLPGAAFARLMARAAAGDQRMQHPKQQLQLLRPQAFSPTGTGLNPPPPQQQQTYIHKQDYLTAEAAAPAFQAVDINARGQQAASTVAGAGAGVRYGDSTLPSTVGERSLREPADGVMRTAAGPTASELSSGMHAIRLLTAGRQPPPPPAPGDYRRHRPLWLGRKPAEPPPPMLQWRAEPPVLWPDAKNVLAAMSLPPPMGTAHAFSRVGQAEQAMQQEQQLPTLLGEVGLGDDDSSSLASSSTAKSLREIQPSLGLELRRRELLNPYGTYGTSGHSGVSGVTVRTLKREVTAGPHVKLLKPRQMLRNLQPPGPTPAFTHRQAAPAPKAPSQGAETDGAAAEPPAELQPVQDPATHLFSHADTELGGPDRDALPAQMMPQQQSPRADTQMALPTDVTSTGLPPPRQTWAVPPQQQTQEQERDATGWVRPSPTLLRLADWSTVAPAVRTLAPEPLLGDGHSPTRLLRMPQGPGDHQRTRRHVHQGFAGNGEAPRYLNVKLMRVLEPQTKSASNRLPGEEFPPGLPMRKLRALDRPEGELPGIIPAGTAGRTEHLLGMLRRGEDRTRPTTGLPDQPISLFDPTDGPTANLAASAAPRGPDSMMADFPLQHQQLYGHPQPQGQMQSQPQPQPQPQSWTQ